MLDSTGKLPDAIFQGHINPIGSMDECLDVDVITGDPEVGSFR